jgi:thioredoxin reductase (NADPH)
VGPTFEVDLDDRSTVRGRSVIIATGLSWRRLEVEGAERYQGAGLYYGASLSEAVGCKGEDVYLVGGANSAGQAALHFARYARRVTMLVRGDGLERSMSHYLVRQIEETDNIEVRPRSEVRALQGEGHLEGIRFVDHGREMEAECGGLYIFIGAVPRTEWLQGVLPLDERGFVLSGSDLPRGWPLARGPFLFETMLPGVFVAGDVRHGSIKRVASSVGEGSICVQLVHQFLGTN